MRQTGAGASERAMGPRIQHLKNSHGRSAIYRAGDFAAEQAEEKQWKRSSASAMRGAHSAGRGMNSTRSGIAAYSLRMIPPQYVKPYVKRNKTDDCSSTTTCRSREVTPPLIDADPGSRVPAPTQMSMPSRSDQSAPVIT